MPSSRIVTTTPLPKKIFFLTSLAPKKKKNKTGLQPFQDPVEQFLGFFPQVKREFKGHILNKWTGRRKRQTELAALCTA